MRLPAGELMCRSSRRQDRLRTAAHSGVVDHFRYTSRRFPILTTSTRKASSSMLAMMRQSPTRYFQKAPRLEPLRASPMLRGSSRLATRSRRNEMMRLATVLSSPDKSFLTWSAISIFQAKIALHFFQRVGAAAACANVGQSLLCKV